MWVHFLKAVSVQLTSEDSRVALENEIPVYKF